MNASHGRYLIDDDPGRVDHAVVRDLLASMYWWPADLPLDTVRRAAAGSALVVGAYLGVEQVGYLRAVTDGVTFAWLCDVVVAPSHRGFGLGRAMVRFAVQQPHLSGLKRWVLATRDAHGVYSAEGFAPLPAPDRWMVRSGPAFRPGDDSETHNP